MISEIYPKLKSQKDMDKIEDHSIIPNANLWMSIGVKILYLFGERLKKYLKDDFDELFKEVTNMEELRNREAMLFNLETLSGDDFLLGTSEAMFFAKPGRL